MRSMRRLPVLLALALVLWFVPLAALELTALPKLPDSLKFAVIGDSGTGGSGQYALARVFVEAHAEFPFDFVIMMGDKLYGRERPEDFVKKFEAPYRPLLDAGVKFYASLGNHDEPELQVVYPHFNMNGRRYYTFTKGPVEFFVLDSTDMNTEQTRWLEGALAASTAPWKIAYMHHPIYSSGKRHGSDLRLRSIIEPLFIKYGVNVVFAGHEHFYERIHPQQGIRYFTVGSAGKLRRGNIRPGPLHAAGFDTDLSFMLVEIAGDRFHFEVISRAGKSVDSGEFARTADVAAPVPTTY